MDIAMTLPTMLPHTRDQFVRWCRSIDEGPWSSLAVPERVTYTSHSLTVQLGAAAALTERVRLWTTIVILPAHDEVQVAKDMASVDRLCDGRLTVGVGVGGRQQDYRAIGGDFSRRWQRMDDQVARMRRIWAQEPPFEGSDPVGPPPVQPGGPPFVAGVMGPMALARAARWAVGVDDPSAIIAVDVPALAGQRQKVVDAWKEAGRDEAPALLVEPLVCPRPRRQGAAVGLRVRLHGDLRRRLRQRAGVVGVGAHAGRAEGGDGGGPGSGLRRVLPRSDDRRPGRARPHPRRTRHLRQTG